MKSEGQQLSAASSILRREILALFTHHIRLTPVDIKRALRSLPQRPHMSQISEAVNGLVQEGWIGYTNHFSITHLERTTKESASPSGIQISHSAAPDRYQSSQIHISDGVAFGMGDHPTTRLAIAGLSLVANSMGPRTIEKASVLDVGTGSGVLAIAAVHLGASRALGLDIDTQARHEARSNVLRNGMEDRITISDSQVEQLRDQEYAIVLANLRPPTLKRLFPELRRITAPNGYWVLSGFRPEDALFIEQAVAKVFFSTMWRADESGWAAVVAKAAKQPEKLPGWP